MSETMEASNRHNDENVGKDDGNMATRERTDAPGVAANGANGGGHGDKEGDCSAADDETPDGIGAAKDGNAGDAQVRSRRKKRKKLNKRIRESDFYGTLHIEPSYPDPGSTYYLDTVKHYLEMDIPEGAVFTNDDGTTEPLLPKKAKRWSMGARFENVTPEGCDMVIEKLDDRDWDFPSMDLNTFARDMLDQYVVVSGTVYRIGCDRNDNDNVYIKFGKLLYSDEDLSYERMCELGYRQHRDQVMQEIAEGKREPIPEWKYPDLPHVDYREARRGRRKGHKGGDGRRDGRDRNGTADDERTRDGRYGRNRYDRDGDRRDGRRSGGFQDDVDSLRSVPANEIVVNRAGRNGEAVMPEDSDDDNSHNGVFDPMSLFDPKPDGKFAKCFIEVPRWKFRQHYRPDLYGDEGDSGTADGVYAMDEHDDAVTGDAGVTVEFGSSGRGGDDDSSDSVTVDE